MLVQKLFFGLFSIKRKKSLLLYFWIFVFLFINFLSCVEYLNWLGQHLFCVHGERREREREMCRVSCNYYNTEYVWSIYTQQTRFENDYCFDLFKLSFRLPHEKLLSPGNTNHNRSKRTSLWFKLTFPI